MENGKWKMEKSSVTDSRVELAAWELARRALDFGSWQLVAATEAAYA
jgi:hypothetical protein